MRRPRLFPIRGRLASRSGQFQTANSKDLIGPVSRLASNPCGNRGG
jgi:hypothetical protein